MIYKNPHAGCARGVSERVDLRLGIPKGDYDVNLSHNRWWNNSQISADELTVTGLLSMHLKVELPSNSILAS